MRAAFLNRNLILRVGLLFVAALSLSLIVACSSQPEPVPTRVPAPTPTATAVIPASATPEGDTPTRSMAPNFSAPSASGEQVSLSSLLEEYRTVVLVFYRGFF